MISMCDVQYVYTEHAHELLRCVLTHIDDTALRLSIYGSMLHVRGCYVKLLTASG